MKKKPTIVEWLNAASGLRLWQSIQKALDLAPCIVTAVVKPHYLVKHNNKVVGRTYNLHEARSIKAKASRKAK